MAKVEQAAAQAPRRIDVPVRYGGEDGPDLAFVASYHATSAAEIVRMHTGRDYTVFMMGFTPGFPYMGKLDDAIATPRLETPRTHVPGRLCGDRRCADRYLSYRITGRLADHRSHIAEVVRSCCRVTVPLRTR